MEECQHSEGFCTKAFYILLFSPCKRMQECLAWETEGTGENEQGYSMGWHVCIRRSGGEETKIAYSISSLSLS